MTKTTTGKSIGKDLTVGPILPLLLTFAFPMVLTNLIQQLYSMVDLIIIGQYAGTVGTVAVATGGELSDMMTPIATAFSVAGQIYIAQLTGAKEHNRLKDAIGTVLSLMMCLSFVFAIIAFLFHNQILALLNCPQEAFTPAAQYMLITAAGMPFIFGYNAVCAILRGMGESKKPLIFVSIAAIVNIFGDLLLVVVFGLGAAGTAIATVASQFGAFLAAFIFMYHRREQIGFQLKPSYFKMHIRDLRIILRLGIPQLIRTFAVQGSMMWVKSNINAYGMTASSTYSIGNKIEKLMTVFVQGIDAAAGAMIGQNLGAKKYDRIKEILKKTLVLTMGIAVVTCVLFLNVPQSLYRMFTQEPEVLEFGIVFLRIMALGCFVVAAANTFKAMATGAGAAGLCFIIGILDGVCRILICLFFVNVLKSGAQSYFWGAALCQALPGFIAFLYYASGKWKTKKLLSEM